VPVHKYWNITLKKAVTTSSHTPFQVFISISLCYPMLLICVLQRTSLIKIWIRNKAVLTWLWAWHLHFVVIVSEWPLLPDAAAGVPHLMLLSSIYFHSSAYHNSCLPSTGVTLGFHGDRFENFTAMKIQVVFFWVVTPCRDVAFRGTTSPWKWRQHGFPKLLYPTTWLLGVTTQKTSTWNSGFIGVAHWRLICVLYK
jgi:hypothetical protein